MLFLLDVSDTAAGSLISMLARVTEVVRQPPTGERVGHSVMLPSSADVISSHSPDPHEVYCFSLRGRGHYHSESCLCISNRVDFPLSYQFVVKSCQLTQVQDLFQVQAAVCDTEPP